MDELEHVKEKEFRHNFRMLCSSVIDQGKTLDRPFTPVLQFTIPMKEAQKPYSYSLFTVMLGEMALQWGSGNRLFSRRRRSRIL